MYMSHVTPSNESIYFTTTHFFRSNTETLFPTGLMVALPSLEKFRFP